MHGLFYYTQPLFALILFLFTGVALFMGVFKAHKETASLPKKIGVGVLSGLISVIGWGFMYSWTYLSW